MQQETCLFISTNITPQKRDGKNCVLKFFHRDWRRCTMSYPRMVKTISLGMWTSPLNQNTLGLHTFNSCFSIIAIYRINLERLLFILLWFLFCETTTLSFIYENSTGNMGWHILYAFIVLGKGMFKLIFNDTYSCMIHELRYDSGWKQIWHQE